MTPTFNEKLIAYLALISGLLISGVAEYYSIVGFTAIFAAAVIPVIIMGIALGAGKIVATVWLKQNWKIAPFAVKAYLMSAIGILMFTTSIGIFGFLSKAHSDQSLVSGDVLAKISVYDEKIKTSKENIDANRKALKQMDEAVDQVMGRSTDEKGADKAVALRRGQQKERARLLAEIEAEQKKVSALSEERAPIAAEVRKVEAEVGPIKYIAAFIYGDTDATVLEKAVTWVIIILIIVFDPLALILLLSSQISFQNFREREKEEIDWQARTDELLEIFDEAPDPWVADVGEKPTAEELAEGDSPEKESDVVSTATVTAQEVADVIPEAVVVVEEKSILEQHPYLTKPFKHFENLKPMVSTVDNFVEEKVKAPTPIKNISNIGGATKVFKRPENVEITEEVVQEALVQDNVPVPTKVHHIADGEYIHIDGQVYHKNSMPPGLLDGYVQNEEQKESNLWSSTVGQEDKEQNAGKNNTNNPA